MLFNVNTALSGVVRTHNGLRFVQDRNCIMRREDQSPKTKVKLISGGGSGHEPVHNGYVGKGMLDAAVSGDVFCSPSVTSIVDCLRMVAKPDESVLFIVNSNIGDRLNFGSAVELARSQYGYENLQFLLNDDDCSIMDPMARKSVGKRGLAGCVLLIKILGAMAELGYSLDELVRFGEGIRREGCIATFGFAFDVIDGHLHNVELGKGLQGEPGVYKLATSEGFQWIVHYALDRVAEKIEPYTDTDVVVLVNNLGGTSQLVMDVFMSELWAILPNDYNIKRVYAGNFFTSLNQSGLSITLLNLRYSDKLLEFLDYEVQVASPLFRGLQSYDLNPSETLKFEDRPEFHVPVISPRYKLRFNESSQPMIKNILKHISISLFCSQNWLNIYDEKCGDGDTGNTIANGAMALIASLDSKLDLIHPAKMFHDISLIMQRSIGGTAGAIYSLFFQGASKAFADADNDRIISIKHWLWALSYGNDAIVQYGFTEVGDRTMLDPLKQGEIQLRESILENRSTLTCVEEFATACQSEAEATRRMVPRMGRASYCAAAMEASNFEHPDPGAHAVAVWTWALYEGYKEHFTG